MAITVTLSPYVGDLPLYGVQARAVFVARAEYSWNWLATNTISEFELFKTQANDLETNVNAKEVLATSAASAAVGAANYKGDWVSGYQTTGYSIGMSVTWSGSQYTSKINNNIATPSGVTDANWLKIVSEDPTKLTLAQAQSAALCF